MRYNFALIDWDGCLCDTLSGAKQIALTLAARNSVSLSEAKLRDIYGDWEKAAAVSKFTNLDEYKSEYNLLARTLQNSAPLNPNAESALKNMKEKGIKVGVVTSSSRLHVEKLIQNLGIEALIESVVGVEDVVHTKPHPEPIEKMLNILGASPAASVMIGDTEKDILAANAAGIDSIWYNPKFNRDFYGEMPELAELATIVVEDWSEVQELFQRNSGV